MHIAQRLNVLEGPGWSGLVMFEFATKPDQPEISGLIRSKVYRIKEKF